MKRYALIVLLAVTLLNAQPVKAQSPCHVGLSTDNGVRQPGESCEAIGAQTITLGGENGFATVTLSGGARQRGELTSGAFLEPIDMYAGRACQGLPPRLDFHFSRKVFNVSITMAAETEFEGALDVTVADNKGRSYVQRMTLGGFFSTVGFGGGDINHITITTAAPSWHWQIYGIQFDDETKCPGNPSPSPSPTPTRSSSDDVAVALRPDPSPSPGPTDHNFFGIVPPSALTQTVRKVDGPIHRDVNVFRVVSDLKPDGTLQNPADLIANGVVSKYATLRIPAYDVDSTAGERDHVLFNGVEIGSGGGTAYLQGQDKKWSVSEFQIPIELVRFGKRNVDHPPTPGQNEVTILVDEDSGGWRVAIAAPSIEFQALYPVVMVHGNNSCGNFFAGDYRTKCEAALDNDFQLRPESEWFIKTFKDKGIPFDNSIDMPTDTVSRHADYLLVGGPKNKSIKAIAAEFGAKHVHIITHSKGGIDVREYLTRLPSGNKPTDFGVISVTTLSGPHLGSVGADYEDTIKQLKDMNQLTTDTILVADNPLRAGLTAAMGSDIGIPDLRVDKMRQFNRTNIPALPSQFWVEGQISNVSYYVLGADANLDDSAKDESVIEKFHPEKYLPTITDGEETKGVPYFPGLQGFTTLGKGELYTNIYRMFGSVHAARIVSKNKPGLGVPRPIPTIGEVPEPCWFLANDFAVTWLSALAVSQDPCVFVPDPQSVHSILPLATTQALSVIKSNHATLSNPVTAQIVLNWILMSQPIPRN